MAQAKPAARSGTLKWLGEGATASVVRVRDGSKLVALKLFLKKSEYKAELDIFESLRKHTPISQHIIKYLGKRELIPRPNPRNLRDVPATMDGLLLEWAPLGSVKDFIYHWRPLLTQDVLCHWTAHIAAALTYLARNNYIVCDVKPENILVREDKSLVLADFGMALETKGTPVDLNYLRGTPRYSAPEALERKAVTPAVDVFSLGLCVYEWATGILLTAAETKEEFSLEQIDQADVILQRIRGWKTTPALPSPWSAAFNQVVQGMLYRFPSGRATAASIVATELINATRNQPLEIQLGMTGKEALSAQQALNDNTSLHSTIAQLNQHLDMAQRDLQHSKGEVANLQTRVQAELANAKSASEDLQRAKDAGKKARQDLQEAREDARVARGALVNLQESFAEATSNLGARASAAHSGAVQDTIPREQHESEMINVSRAVDDERIARAKAEGEVAQLQQEVATLREERNAANAKIESFFFKTVTGEIDSLRAQLAASQKKLEGGALRALEEQLRTVRAERDALRMQLDARPSAPSHSRKRLRPEQELNLSQEMGNLSTHDDGAQEPVGHSGNLLLV